MLAADDGKPDTLAAMHEVTFVWDDPHDAPDAGKRTYDTMFPDRAVRVSLPRRERRRPCRAGRLCLATGARMRTSRVDAAGELYIFSKTDGMIRIVVGGAIK